MDVFPAGDGCSVGTKASSLRFAQRTSQGTRLSLSVHFESHAFTVQRSLIARGQPAAQRPSIARHTLVVQRVFAAYIHYSTTRPPAYLLCVRNSASVCCSISARSPSIVHGPQFNACQLFTVHPLFGVYLLFNAHPLLNVRPQRVYPLFDVSKRYPGFPEIGVPRGQVPNYLVEGNSGCCWVVCVLLSNSESLL